MKRQFRQTHIVRYDECNCDGMLTPTAFVRYMQDIAARDAEDAQLSGNGYWVVKRTVISFKAPVQVHTRLELKTYGIGFSRITAQRGYEARITDDHSDEPIISARSLWVYVDPRGRPIRLPERTGQIWLPDGPLPHQPEVPLPAFPESTPETTTSFVRFSDIDPMRHMNNASAVEMLDNAGWEAYTKGGITPEMAQLDVLHYDIEYVDSPRFGDRLEIQSWLVPFPVAGQEFSRFQQITQGKRVMVRAHSRWIYRAEKQR
jgi:acyl-CoA thioesterase FadM